jgi:hypothetical protein
VIFSGEARAEPAEHRFFRRRPGQSARVASDGAGKPRCSKTGLAIPECSCGRCLEAMLRQHSPTLLASEIVVIAMRHPERPRGEPSS